MIDSEMIRSLGKKIVELEKKIDLYKVESKTLYSQWIDVLTIQTEKIEKLKNRVDAHKLTIINMGNAMNKEIKELKEQFELHKTSHHHPNLYKMIKGNWNLIKQQEEALREFLWKFDGHLVLDHEYQEKSMAHEHIKTLVNKLGGETSVSRGETVSLEKPPMIVKESPIETLQNSKPSEQDINYEKLREYSGVSAKTKDLLEKEPTITARQTDFYRYDGCDGICFTCDEKNRCTIKNPKKEPEEDHDT